MGEPSILIDDVHKSFPLGRSRIGSLKTLALWGRAKEKQKYAEVLNGVSLRVEKGESVALIGRNGAGKSTLLMIIAQIYRPTQGTATVNGRIAPLLELGAGFHPDLSGRDNVIFNAMLLGLSQKDIRGRLSEIIEFADIGEYIERPTRTYSSGMQARLGFSVAIHVNPDVLIVDEVLSVGDVAFVRKCQNKVSEYRDQGGTILLVSHSMDMIRHISDRVVWLESGRVHDEGKPEDVLPRYAKFMGAALVLAEGEAIRHHHPTSPEDVRAENSRRDPVRYLIHVPMTIGVAFRFAMKELFDEPELCEVYRIPNGIGLPEFVKRPLPNECKFVLGHFSTAFRSAIGAPGRFFAFFRDPLVHALVLYRQEQRHPTSPYHTFANELSVSEFFDASVSPLFENPVTKLLAGTIFQDDHWHEIEVLDDELLLGRALAALKELEYIGVVEDLDSSLRELSDLVGKDIILGEHNVDPEPIHPDCLTAEEREHILAHFRLDVRLYAAAVEERALRREAAHPVEPT